MRSWNSSTPGQGHLGSRPLRRPEWFDDEFGSMKKSDSIIQVPERVSVKAKAEPSAGKTTQEARVAAKKNAKLDLKKIVEEPFYAVPHNVNEVKDLASKSVEVFMKRCLTRSLPQLKPQLTSWVRMPKDRTLKAQAAGRTRT